MAKSQYDLLQEIHATVIRTETNLANHIGDNNRHVDPLTNALKSDVEVVHKRVSTLRATLMGVLLGCLSALVASIYSVVKILKGG